MKPRNSSSGSSSGSGVGGPTTAVGGCDDDEGRSGGVGAFAAGGDGGGRRSAGCYPRQGAEHDVLLGGVGDKENVGIGCSGAFFGERKQGVAGRDRAGPPKGASERNALVERLLEANREVLIWRR